MNPTQLMTSTPTLRDIAKAAGVSHTTVALSLRHDASLPISTRNRICEIAETMGYRSNVLVSALMTQVRSRNLGKASEVVGFLTGGATRDEWKNHSAMRGFYEGARLRGLQVGIRVEPYWLGPEGMNTQATGKVLHARAIRGNLLAPFAVPVYRHGLDWEKFICVALGYAYRDVPLHRATHHHFRGSYEAVNHLAQLGYRRIGLMIGSSENSRVGYTWLGGYQAATHMAQLPIITPFFHEPTDSIALTKGWIRREKPDAVIGYGNKQLEALEEAGVRVPSDVAFAALDTHQIGTVKAARLAGIDQNLPVIGAAAIDILAGRLSRNERGLAQQPTVSVIEGFWTDGDTAPPAGKRGRRPQRR